MKTQFGLRGAIVPPGPFAGKSETFLFQNFIVEIEDGVIAIGFDDESLTDRARAVVEQHLAWFNKDHGFRHVAMFNESWATESDGTAAMQLSLSDALSFRDEATVRQISIPATGRVVSATYSSASLASYSSLTEKSLRHAALGAALVYFNDEALDEERPLYGIHKAIEALISVLPDGKAGLGMLAGQPNKKAGKRYVDDITETAGLTRHHNDLHTKRILTDAECKERAKLLLDAFAQTV